MGVVEEDGSLRRWLEQVLADRGPIAAVHRSRLPHIGSYDCDRVTVELRSGDRLALFLKDFARSRLTKDDPEQRRLRELRVYRDLLDGAGLGTPRYYGSAWDDPPGRFWLLLEMVAGDVVRQVDARDGPPAAAWLARLQGRFLGQAERLEACDFLIDHDATYFESKAGDARRDVGELAPAWTARLEGVLACYERCIPVMSGPPRSLVHGGYIPWHILVDRSVEPARVCAVDWELAARGATLYDLAIFTDDAAPPLQEQLCRVYRDEAARHGVPVPAEREMRRQLACFRLHRVVDWLSRSAEKQYPEKKIRWLVERAETVAATVTSDA